MSEARQSQGLMSSESVLFFFFSNRCDLHAEVHLSEGCVAQSR